MIICTKEKIVYVFNTESVLSAHTHTHTHEKRERSKYLVKVILFLYKKFMFF